MSGSLHLLVTTVVSPMKKETISTELGSEDHPLNERVARFKQMLHSSFTALILLFGTLTKMQRRNSMVVEYSKLEIACQCEVFTGLRKVFVVLTLEIA